MSEAKDDYSGGDKINATELNKISENANDAGGFRDDKNAGETIAGATLPVPVYQNTTDNEFYKCDANVSTKLNFVGFAISDGTDGNPIDIQMTGIVRGFSGLSEGVKYYLSDSAGYIGTTPGTYEVLVGIAISETELLIMKGSEEYIGSANVDTDGTTMTTVPAGTRKIIVKAHKAGAGDATNGNGFSGGEIVLTRKGITESLVSMSYAGGSGGSPTNNFRAFRAIWVTATTMTGKTFSGHYTVEAEDTGYTITAYFYK